MSSEHGKQERPHRQVGRGQWECMVAALSLDSKITTEEFINAFLVYIGESKKLACYVLNHTQAMAEGDKAPGGWSGKGDLLGHIVGARSEHVSRMGEIEARLEVVEARYGCDAPEPDVSEADTVIGNIRDTDQ